MDKKTYIKLNKLNADLFILLHIAIEVYNTIV